MTPSGLYRGTVERISGNRAWVTIPALGGDKVYGGRSGCEVYVSVGLVDAPAGSTTDPTTSGDHSHTVTLRPLAKGDGVLVGFLQGRAEEIVVIGMRR